MVAPADVARHIDLNLHSVGSELAFLPTLAELWGTMPPHEQSSWDYEWRDLWDRFGLLEEACRAGHMTQQQAARFRQLAKDVQRSLPTFRQLGLPLPAERAVDE
jgi:hypothetical protein